MPSKKKSRKTKSKIPLKWVENGNGSFSLLIDAPSKKTTDNNDKVGQIKKLISVFKILFWFGFI